MLVNSDPHVRRCFDLYDDGRPTPAVHARRHACRQTKAAPLHISYRPLVVHADAGNQRSSSSRSRPVRRFLTPATTTAADRRCARAQQIDKLIKAAPHISNIISIDLWLCAPTRPRSRRYIAHDHACMCLVVHDRTTRSYAYIYTWTRMRKTFHGNIATRSVSGVVYWFPIASDEIIRADRRPT